MYGAMRRAGFKDAVVSAFNLTELVTAPVKDMMPVTTAINAVHTPARQA